MTDKKQIAQASFMLHFVHDTIPVVLPLQLKSLYSGGGYGKRNCISTYTRRQT
jgi:hypothetical protein